MTIAAVCPHCETRFQLQPDLIGKTIRCPNGDCREPFEVVEQKPIAEAPPAPVPEKRPEPSPANEPFLPMLVAEPAAPYERIEREPAPTFLKAERIPNDEDLPVAKRLPTKEELPVAQLLPPVTVAKRLDQPTGAKEVDWASDIMGQSTAANGPPLPPPIGPSSDSAMNEAIADGATTVEDANEPLLFRRKKSRSIPQLILVGLILTTLFFGIGSAVWWFYYRGLSEAQRANQAKESYDAGNYSVASSQYEAIQKEFPNSKDLPKYQFLMQLAKVRNTTSSVGAKETPSHGLNAYRDFVKEYGQHPLAKTGEEGFARDIYETGRQVIDSLAGNGELKAAEFKADRTKPKRLDEAESSIDDGRKVIPILQPFKEKDSALLDPQNAALDKVSATIAFERKRLALFAPYRDIVENPTDERIEEFERMLVKNKLDFDEEGTRMLAQAKAELRKRVVAVAQSVPAVPNPPEGDPGIAFASSVERPPVAPGSERKPTEQIDVMFAVARGIVYALDAETGNVLWTCRVAASNVDPKTIDLPIRTSLGEGGQDLVVLPVKFGEKAGLAGRVAATGEPLWFQPLEAAVAGRPVVQKDRVYVALRDANGTVVEIDLASGRRIGMISLRQPIGPGAALFPGSGLLYVPALARRVFVLDINARDPDGKRLPPKCVQILATEHPPGGLLCEPVPVGPPGRSSEQRYLVVAQSTDPTSMKLRAFALPELVENQATTDVALAPVAELNVPGWAAYPPTTDGERISVVTDAGKLAVFGVNQGGNLDKALFALPVPSQRDSGTRELVRGGGTDASVRRGQVVLAEEDGYWIVIGGELKCLKVSLDAANGRTLTDRVLPSRTIGEPLTRPQINERRDLAIVTVRNPRSFGCRAIGFDPRNGAVRWQRQLGAIPPSPVVRLGDGSAVLVDEDGGTFVVPANQTATTLSPSSTAVNVAFGLMAPNGTPSTAMTPDASACWVLIPELPDRTQLLRVRKVTSGKLAYETSIPLPARLAGRPLAMKDSLMIPLADGIVYRFSEKQPKLTPGPTWKGPTAPAESTCYLAPTSKPNDFFGTDGNQKFHRWSWEDGESDAWKATTREAWEALGPIPFAPIAVTDGDRELVLVPDPAGVTAYSANAPSEPIIRWKPGKPTRGFVPLKNRILLAVEGGDVVCIDPHVEKLAWQVPPTEAGMECIGLTAVGNSVYATDLVGRVMTISLETGKSTSLVTPVLTTSIPTEGITAVSIPGGRILLPLSDGTAVYLLAGE